MWTRRNFLSRLLPGVTLGAAASSKLLLFDSCLRPKGDLESEVGKPVVLATWRHGFEASQKAWETLGQGGQALDAVEQGVRLVEADPSSQTVGYGGFLDRDGRLTLDASIMQGDGKCGAVCALEHIMHPISVARMVMEKTPHVMLAGEGALDFALSQGFQREDLLTEQSREGWEKWKKESRYEPKINVENHDTIGMLALDEHGQLAGACTTSGLAYKMHGRVGDSPIIGAGLFVDGEVGAAVATGLGEEIIRTAGAFLIVELMRQGRSPQEACEEAIRRFLRKEDKPEFQVGYLSMDRNGRVGACSIYPGFDYAYFIEGQQEMVPSVHLA